MAHDILIVDDEEDIRELISGILADEGYETRIAANGEEALKALHHRRPALIILDIWLRGSGYDGLQLLDIIASNYPAVPVVMISGHGNIETAVSTIQRGAYDFIEKPFKSDRLLLIVQRAIESAKLKRENEELRLRGGYEEELIGQGAGATQIRNAINKVARTGSRVLITGPSGSGKEVVARLIHKQSARAENPFVVLNAATMAPERMEIELFGVEGNPKDNVAPRIGTFEQAHSGTLLLDEIGDMPLETQSKILRVLVEQTFHRVGGTTPVRVDVRVISSSSRDPATLITDGRLREDLYHRLNVVPIQVPSLKDRREDIPDLAQYFMKRFAESSGLAAREIGEDAIAALQAYEWTGNVRQLRNVIEQLLIMSPGDAHTPIRADMLPPELGAVTPAILRRDGHQEIMALPLRDAREVFEREYLLAQITRFGGNISRTAAFIGMERSALHRKLKLLGVNNTERT